MRIVLACVLASSAIVSPAENTPPSAVDASSDAVRFDLVRYRDRVEEDGSSTRTMEARVLLRTAAAVAELGQLAVPYIDGLGQVQVERLVVEKPDGHSVDVKNAAVEDINPFGITGGSVAADVRVRKVTIPGLEPGDTLSYQFVIRQKPLTPGHIFGEMKLIPAMGDPLQSYELDLPRRAQVQVRLREGLGASWEEMPSSPDRLVRKLAHAVLRPVAGKSLNKEQLRAWTDPDVSFTNFRTWPEVATWWWELSRGRLIPDAAIKTEALSIVANASSSREKMAALHHYVSSRVRYLNVNFGIGRMQPRPAPEVLTSRYGDCKDKHALLAALAAAVGIEVRPVLIHSSRFDLRDDVPSPEQFDHMISVARLGPDPGDWLWLDSTSPYYPAGYLATSLRDKRALLVEANGDGRIVRTPADPPLANRAEIEVKGSMDGEGKVHAHALFRFRSDDEVPVRAAFSALPPDRWVEVVRMAFLSDWREPKATNVVVSDPADVAEAFRVEFDLEAAPDPDRTKSSWSLWIPLPPVGLPDPEGARTKAKTMPEEETDLVPHEYSARVDLEVPEGITLQAPLSVVLERPFGSLHSSYEVKGRHLTVSRQIEIKSHAVPAEAFKSYVAFYRAVDTDREQKFSVLGSMAESGDASAADLHQAGMTAYGRKEYDEAIRLLRKATEKDAKLESGLLDLGRVLRDNHQKFEAIAAFTRQIELEPFHESAYAERAYTLIDIGRWDEAEQDLLKQIEVAPFKAWSYERLGERRVSQRRFGEAAGYYARAAALEPKEAERWVDLGAAQWQAGQRDEARAALDRARGLEPADWLKVRAATVYAGLGDATVAGELAESAIGSLSERLAKLSSDDFGAKDLYWADRLVEGWSLIGAGALANGDQVKAARYLAAAWRLGFLPDAGWKLGVLREKQDRLREALDLFRLADSLPTAQQVLPADRNESIKRLALKLPDAALALNALMDLRSTHVTGRALKEMSAEVLILAEPDGRVLTVKGLASQKSGDLDLQLSGLGPLRLPSASPDPRALKMVRRGLFACTPSTGCAFVLDVPGSGPGVDSRSTETAVPSFEVTLVRPAKGNVLRLGQVAQLISVVRYNLRGSSEAIVTLQVKDQAGKSLVQGKPLTETLKGNGETSIQGLYLAPLGVTRVEITPLVSIVGKPGSFSLPTTRYSVQ